MGLGRGPDKGMAKLKHGVGNNAWFLALFCSSVGMTIFNKFVVTELPAAYTLLFYQNAMTVVLNFLFAWLGVFEIKPFKLAHFKMFLIPSFLFLLMLATSLKALPLIAVATVVVFRNIGTCVVAVLETVIFKKEFDTNQRFGMVLMVLGAVVYGYFDLHFDFEGYWWISVNTALFATNSLYEKFAVTSLDDQTGTGISVVQTSLSLPILLGLIFFAAEPASLPPMSKISSATLILAMLTGLLGCGISLSYMHLQKFASATSITVAGNANKIASICIGAVLFGKAFGFVQILGLLTCIAGALWYSLATKLGYGFIGGKETLPA